MTGYAENATRNSFLEPGMEIIAKLIEMDVLARKIRQMIEGSANRMVRRSGKFWLSPASRGHAHDRQLRNKSKALGPSRPNRRRFDHLSPDKRRQGAVQWLDRLARRTRLDGRRRRSRGHSWIRIDL